MRSRFKGPIPHPFIQRRKMLAPWRLWRCGNECGANWDCGAIVARWISCASVHTVRWNSTISEWWQCFINRHSRQWAGQLHLNHSSMSEASFEQTSAAYRQYLPDLSTKRFTKAKQQDAYEYSKTFHMEKKPDCLFQLAQAWERLYKEPFKGVTTDG